MKRKIVFCNGWGMDYSSVEILDKNNQNYQIIELNSWHKKKENIDIDEYDEIFLIAWSMGVWASEFIFKDINFTKKIAINGTPIGIDDKYGIREKVFFLTLKNMNVKTRNIFFKNMFMPNEDIYFFSKRKLEDQKEELFFWWENRKKYEENLNWDKAIIGKYDKIVPYENQKKYWNKKETSIKEISRGHYIFNDCFDSWDTIINL